MFYVFIVHPGYVYFRSRDNHTGTEPLLGETPERVIDKLVLRFGARDWEIIPA